MIEANGIRPENVAYAMFTTTSDLDAEFPAVAARHLGWTNVALLCGQEIDVPGSLKGVVRILVLLNTDKTADEIVHVYIKGATELRPDASNSR
jgi:chorismate mutase